MTRDITLFAAMASMSLGADLFGGRPNRRGIYDLSPYDFVPVDEPAPGRQRRSYEPSRLKGAEHVITEKPLSKRAKRRLRGKQKGHP